MLSCGSDARRPLVVFSDLVSGADMAGGAPSSLPRRALLPTTSVQLQLAKRPAVLAQNSSISPTSEDFLRPCGSLRVAGSQGRQKSSVIGRSPGA